MRAHVRMAAGLLPVMVFVHGGAFYFGGGNDAQLIPSASFLNKHQVVLVVPNYRPVAPCPQLPCLANPPVPAEPHSRTGGAARAALHTWLPTPLPCAGPRHVGPAADHGP